MLAIGIAAGAASFTHVHDLAAAHRQGGWLAWADTIVLELMSIASGLEIRRRRRTHDPVAVPATVLVCAVLLSLAAQVIQAEPTPIGWIAAAVPAAGFLTMVKIALGYHRQPSDPHTTAPATDHGMPVQSVPLRTGRDRDGDTDVDRMLPAARDAADRITADGGTITRDLLAEALRTAGYSVSSARVSALIKLLKPGQTAPATTSASTGEATS